MRRRRQAGEVPYVVGNELEHGRVTWRRSGGAKGDVLETIEAG
jgi:hypothetical protein